MTVRSTSHGTTLKKNGVDAVLYPADASVAKVHIVLYGECRDVTTTKDQAGVTEPVTLRQSWPGVVA